MSDRPSLLVTGALVVLGLASVAGAYAMRPVEVPMPVYEDTGQPLFVGFDDPAQATALEVVAWDQASARTRNFAVARVEGRWVIPSHNNYPADAVDRMAAAAASFVGVRKDIYRGDRVQDHAGFGVQDPASAEADEGGRGMHVRIGDASGSSLVDVVIGKKLPDKPGYRFVRPMASDRVYAVKLQLELSTAFADWIDPDLLSIGRGDIVALTTNLYRVDEKTGDVVGQRPARLEQRGSGAWVQVQVPAGEAGVSLPLGQAAPSVVPSGQTIDTQAIAQLLAGLDSLKIAGVRPQPAKLTQRALQSKGFFLSQDMTQLIGNEGQLSFQSYDGITCTLFFGEVSYDSGEALTAGLDAGPGAGPPAPGAKAHRYLFVTVGYDAALDTSAQRPVPAAQPGQPPIVVGEAKAAALRARFERWFYVIDEESFDKLHVDVGAMYKLDKSAPPSG